MPLQPLLQKTFVPQSNQVRWSNPFLLSFFLLFYYCVAGGVLDPSGDGLHYGKLANAFLAGQTYTLEGPPPNVLEKPDPLAYARSSYDHQLNDFILYKNRLYVFYGPVPALLLFVPFKYLTGEEMDSRFAAWILTSLGTIVATMLLWTLAKRLGLENRNQQVFLACLLAVGTFIPYQLRLGYHYQVALGGAYLFTGLAFLSLVHAFTHPTGRPKWLALASLCFGLAAGCRLNFGLSGFLLAFLGIMIGRATGWKWDRALWARGIAISLPFAACIAALGWYNYIRFDTPFTFGVDYQVGYNIIPPLGIKNSLLNAYLTYLHPIPVDWHYPFFHPARCCPMTLDWWTLSPVSSTQEPIHGAFTNAPFLLFLCFFPGILRFASERYSPISWVLVSILVLSIIIAWPSVVWVMATMRYLVDFVPWMMVLAGLSYLHALKRFAHDPKKLACVRIAGTATGAYTLVCGFIIGFLGYAGG
jgi:hypothetical protein